MPRPLMIFYIQGYGIPPDILRDGNYDRYLRDILENHLAWYPHPTVYLGGGASDPHAPLRTEAAAMQRWIDWVAIDWHISAHFITGLSVGENLRTLRAKVDPCTTVILFCEWARQDWFRFVAGRLFPNHEVVPIIFDRGHRPRWSVRIQQWMKLPGKLIRWWLSDPSSSSHHSRSTPPTL